MAKIYETKEDFQRDTLRQQADKTRLEASSQAVGGMSLAVIGTIFESIRMDKPETRKWMSYAALTAFVLGAVEVVRSLFTRSKAHDLDLQNERLGPATVMIPADAMPVETTPSCGCKAKRHTAGVDSRSLLEHAAKPSGTPFAKTH